MLKVITLNCESRDQNRKSRDQIKIACSSMDADGDIADIRTIHVPASCLSRALLVGRRSSSCADLLHSALLNATNLHKIKSFEQIVKSKAIDLEQNTK